jgi:hypothetical protein
MDLVSVHPVFTPQRGLASLFLARETVLPAKFISPERARGQVLDSMINAGVIISSETVRRPATVRTP